MTFILHSPRSRPFLPAPEIELSQCETLTTEGISSLAALPRLEALHISKCRLHDRLLPELAAFQHLISLKLSDMDFSDACMATFLTGTRVAPFLAML